MSCWCKTNDVEKTESVSNANVMESAASIVTLATEASEAEKENAASTEALAHDKALRAMPLAVVTTEEKDSPDPLAPATPPR